jgi:acetyltransferase-like isoleucine patch superfamily enzyme
MIRTNIKDAAKNNRYLRLIVYKIRNYREKKGYVTGNNNKIINNGIKVASRICINGNNNTVSIDKNAVLKNCTIRIRGNNALIHLKSNSYSEGTTFFIEDDHCSIVIGQSTFIGPSHLAATEDQSYISIGDHCMLSSNINIRTGDSHAIIDIEMNVRINQAQNISIGNHCWIGEGVKILKGVILKEDVIVATGSIVTQSFDSNNLIGGIPAKIIKRKVTWDANRNNMQT